MGTLEEVDVEELQEILQKMYMKHFEYIRRDSTFENENKDSF